MSLFASQIYVSLNFQFNFVRIALVRELAAAVSVLLKSADGSPERRGWLALLLLLCEKMSLKMNSHSRHFSSAAYGFCGELNCFVFAAG